MIPKLYHPIGILFLLFFSASNIYAAFSFVCPPDVTVSCREDYLHDLNIFGKAYTDYNGVIKYIHDCKTTIEIDDCGKGTIKRVWGVENPETWQWLTCMQVITISNANGFRYDDVSWPPSLVIRSCDPQYDLKNLQSPYNAPDWERPKCAKPMVSYKDTRFKVHDGCEKILREWKILDWCQYDPVLYPGRGIFSYTQVIKLIHVSDSIGLQCNRDTIVINNRTCDTIYVQLYPALFVSGCNIYHKISNDSKYALQSGNNASGYYPNGIHKFHYIAEYACGEEVKCEATVEVRSAIPPTPYCLTGVILALMPVDTNNDGSIDDGMIEVWASDLDKASWHHCPAQQLSFSFSKDRNDRSRIYNCRDVGTQEVEIWVTDTLGNQDVCKTQIGIQNNNPNIPGCDGNIKGGKKSIRDRLVFSNAISTDNANDGSGFNAMQSDGTHRFNRESYIEPSSVNQLNLNDLKLIEVRTLESTENGCTIEWLLDSRLPQQINIRLYSTDGRVLLNEKYKINDGIHVISQQVNSAGMLFYLIANGKQRISGKRILH